MSGARAVVLLVLDGFGWRAIDAGRAGLPVLGSLEGGPITTVVPSTTAAALTSIATGLTPARHGMVGYRMLVGGQVLDVLRWKVPRGRAPDPALRDAGRPGASAAANVPTVVRAEFDRSGFTESHMRGVRFVGWRTTATLVTHVARLVDAGEPLRLRLLRRGRQGRPRVRHHRRVLLRRDALRRPPRRRPARRPPAATPSW